MELLNVFCWVVFKRAVILLLLIRIRRPIRLEERMTASETFGSVAEGVYLPILFVVQGEAKLLDLGLSRVVSKSEMDNARYSMTGDVGSARYMAPEVLRAQRSASFSHVVHEKSIALEYIFLIWRLLAVALWFTPSPIGYPIRLPHTPHSCHPQCSERAWPKWQWKRWRCA